MKIVPFFNYVIVEREKLKTSKIIIPETAEKRNAPAIGVVAAKGPACEEYIEVGKRVLFKRHAGDWLKDDSGEEYFALEETDLIGALQ